jgi:hypothetical protein
MPLIRYNDQGIFQKCYNHIMIEMKSYLYRELLNITGKINNEFLSEKNLIDATYKLNTRYEKYSYGVHFKESFNKVVLNQIQFLSDTILAKKLVDDEFIAYATATKLIEEIIIKLATNKKENASKMYFNDKFKESLFAGFGGGIMFGLLFGTIFNNLVLGLLVGFGFAIFVFWAVMTSNP